MEVPLDKPAGWGKWDDEIDDMRVSYMVGLIESGHKYKKYFWGGDDAQEILYNHEARKAAKKRKRQGACSKPKAGRAPVMKQKRVNTYFRRPALVDDDTNGELAARVDALEKIVAWMKRKLSRRKRIEITLRKEVFCSGKPPKKKKKKSASAPEVQPLSDEDDQDHGHGPLDNSYEDGGEDDSDPEEDAEEARQSSPHESEDESAEEDEGNNGDEGKESPSGNLKEVSDTEEHDDEVDGGPTKENESEEMDVEAEDSLSEEPPPVLVSLKEGDGVPMQWVDQRVTGDRGAVLYRGTTSKTYYVTEDEVRWEKFLSVDNMDCGMERDFDIWITDVEQGSSVNAGASGENKHDTHVAEAGDETKSKVGFGSII